jgi:EmrB/QacA subfamily drug resistance transporter
MRTEHRSEGGTLAVTDRLRRVALASAILASFLTPFMSSAINIALPAIGEQLSLGAVLLGWVATSYLLAAAMFLMPFGRLADLIGRKRLLATGLALYAVSSVLCALAPSAALLIAFRVAQGIGSALMFSTAVAILTSVYPPGRRGLALGLTAASTYIGLSLGPVLGGVLTQELGWRSIFWFNVPPAAAGLVLVLWRLKGEWAEAKGERFDVPGSVVLGVSLPALIYGLSRLPEPAGIWLLAGGAVGVGAFLFLESRTRYPIFPVALLLRNRTFAFSNLAALINYSATFAVGFLLSLYLQYLKGFSPEQAGLILVSQPVIMAALSPVAGRLSDRVGARVLASAGMALATLGLALFALLRPGTGLALILGGLGVLGLGFALFSSPNTNAVMGSVHRKLYGIASATLGTMRLMGQMLSMAIAILIFTLLIGQTEITPAVYGPLERSLRLAFVIFAALCFVGVFASLARGGSNLAEA